MERDQKELKNNRALCNINENTIIYSPAKFCNGDTFEFRSEKKLEAEVI